MGFIEDFLIEYEEGVSNCCGSKVLENTGRCSACGENCIVVED